MTLRKQVGDSLICYFHFIPSADHVQNLEFEMIQTLDERDYLSTKNVAVMVGHDTMHGTNACNYRRQKDVRIAATIYMADINEENAQIIADDATSIFPLPGDVEWTMAQRGRHWSRDATSSLKYDRGRTSLQVKDNLDIDICQQYAAEGKCEEN